VDLVYREYDEGTKEWTPVRRLRYLTAHSSKGLEADYVFVIADRERGGFPNDVEDDMGVLFAGRGEGIAYAEERRVFYVAMTRARRRLFLVNRTSDGTALSSDSPFMGEIIADNEGMLERSTPVCPLCSWPMMIRDSPRKPFYGCVNYPMCKGTRPFKGL
jgi:DNA helicase-4